MSEPVLTAMAGHGVSVESLDGAGAVAWREALADIYAVVFTEPPYEEGPQQVAQYAKSLPDEFARPGFALTLAFASGTPIGFAYGFTMTADMPVWPLLTDPVGRNLPPAAANEGRLFFMLELAVDPGWRRHGVGRMLHDTLIATRKEKAAILTTRSEALPARSLYLSRGWVAAGSLTRPGHPDHDVLLKTLG